MPTRHQRLIGITLAALLVGATLALVPAAPAAAQDAGNDTATDDATTEITVSTSGQAAGEPTTAVIVVESAATGDTPVEATTRLAENVTQLRAALADANVSEDQLRTLSYNLQQVRPDEEPPRPEQAQANGSEVTYRASQTFELTVENRSRAGELVDVAVANGATSIHDVQFRLSDEDRESLRQQALERAMDRARTEAETLAGAEDLTITGVRSISTSQSFFEGGGAVAFEEADAATTIESGPVTVHATVDVTYEAEDE